MGKPAARIGDTTAHGGTITGPGIPNVLIGSMPAATMGDMHVCPMVTGTVPHAGGPVVLGSTGVFIGKKPAARMGDTAVCVGPPSSVLLGCMTVLIGEVGSGSQAASAGAAAEASLAGLDDPSAIEPFPLEDPPPLPDQLHWCRFRFVDKASRPLPGIPFTWAPPGKEEMPGMSDPEGGFRQAGLASTGSYTVSVKDISRAEWGRAEAHVGEEISLSAVAEGFEDGEVVVFSVLEESNGGNRRFAARFPVEVGGGRIEASWKIDLTQMGPMQTPDNERARVEKKFRFIAYGQGAVAVSGALTLWDGLRIEVVDHTGQGKRELEMDVVTEDGKKRRQRIAVGAVTTLADLAPGRVRFENRSEAK